MYRTSAHLRRAANGVIGAILLTAVAAFAAVTIWPSRAGTVGSSSVVQDIRREGWDTYAPAVMIVAGLLALWCLVYAKRRASRWRFERRVNRVSAALDTTDATMLDPTTEHRAIASGLRAPRIQWVEGPRKIGLPLRRLTPTTNVIGGPRLQITYLRLFNNEHRHISFVKGAWREFGSVRMLRSAVSMTEAEAKRARHVGMDSLFVTTRPQLEAALSAVGNTPTYRANRVEAGPMRVTAWDKYGAYPMCSILCANATWRAAVNRLIDTADLVVVDLSGYTSKHAGTRYELQRVLDRVPAERLIYLADPVSKNGILEKAITEAWFGMEAGSPNAARPDIPLWIARVDKLVKHIDPETHTAARVELVTSRKETRRLLVALQQRLQGARPISPESRSVGHESPLADVDPWAAYGASAAVPAAEPAPAAPVAPVAPVDHAPADTRLPGARRRRRPLIAAVVALVLVAGVAGYVLLGDSDEPRVEADGPIDVTTCDAYVVQLGALGSEPEAEQRVADVRSMLDRLGASYELGWLKAAPCGFSANKPNLYFAVAGPFAEAGEAEAACRMVRTTEISTADEFTWARSDAELAGHRRLDGEFAQCT